MQAIQYEFEDGVGVLTLNRPARKNAIDKVMSDELKQVLFALPQQRDLRALVITGAGGAFCAGGDITNMMSAASSAEAGRDRMRHDYLSWIETLLRLEVPVIAAVQGPAFGAGFSLALTDDFVVAEPGSRFCMSFVRLGLVPDCGAFYTLPRIVGVQRAKELCFSGRELGLAEAHQLGIVTEIASANTGLARAKEIARCFAAAAPASLTLMKRALNVSMNSSLDAMIDIEAAAQGIARTSPWHAQAVSKFLAKEPAMFQWPAQPDA